MSVDSRIFTRILLENQISRNRTGRRIASRNLTSELVPYLQNEMASLSNELTAEETRANSPARRRKQLQPIRLFRETMRSAPRLERAEQRPERPEQSDASRPVLHANASPLRLCSILEKCSKFHRPANCSLSSSEQFIDRQLEMSKKKADLVKNFSMSDIEASDMSGYEQTCRERREREERRRFNVLTRVCHENRKKLQKAINKREKARAKFYTIT